jgi:hypothetical protein
MSCVNTEKWLRATFRRASRRGAIAGARDANFGKVASWLRLYRLKRESTHRHSGRFGAFSFPRAHLRVRLLRDARTSLLPPDIDAGDGETGEMHNVGAEIRDLVA